jgi:hypothetical protein
MSRLLNVLSPWASQRVWAERGLSGLDSCLQDVRYAARSMRARPGFTLITISEPRSPKGEWRLYPGSAYLACCWRASAWPESLRRR